MRVLREGNLEILVPSSALAVKLDADPAVRNRSQCGVKSVDFVVCFEDTVYFIEIKDPANPMTPPRNFEVFVRRAKEGKLLQDLVHKFMDSLLFWLMGSGEFHRYKRIYLVLITRMERALLQAVQHDLQQCLASGEYNWAHRCFAFDEEMWNRRVPDILPGSFVRRISG